MTAETDLLPCPFCNAPAERIDFGPEYAENEGGSCIACTRCQSSGPVEFGRKENFVSNWNRRACVSSATEALRDENAALRDELDNKWAEGVHSCGDHCQRTSCVLRRDNERLAEALRLIAAPIRPDGTWNRDREACRQIARDALDQETTK